MTMVSGKLIGAVSPQRVEMVATLVDAAGNVAVGYVAAVPGELVKPVTITPAADGTWQADLTPNSLITCDVGDTLWAVQEGRALDGTPILTHVVVPETGGPYWVGDIRAAVPGTVTGGSSVVYLAGPQGDPGPAGAAGPAGADGASAYEVAVADGFTGTEADWLASLVGPQGEPGPAGDPAPARAGVILPVDGQPANTVGVDGDWALSMGERRLYGPKTAGVWETWSRIDPPTAVGWQRNGFAVLVGSDLYLTHATDGFGSGTSWRTGTDATEGLDVSFTVEMSGGTGADGVTFAIADPATPATFQGGGGGDLGLVGCTSVAVALDTGAGSRARIVTTDATSMTALATYGGTLDLRAAPVRVRVLHETGALSVWADSVLLFDRVPVTVPSTGRVGWTGANGGANDDHIVRSVQFVAKGGIQL